MLQIKVEGQAQVFLCFPNETGGIVDDLNRLLSLTRREIHGW